MVSIFLVVAAILTFCAGALIPYGAVSAGHYELARADLPFTLELWLIAAVLFGSAAVVDSVKSSMRKLLRRIEEIEEATR